MPRLIATLVERWLLTTFPTSTSEFWAKRGFFSEPVMQHLFLAKKLLSSLLSLPFFAIFVIFLGKKINLKEIVKMSWKKNILRNFSYKFDFVQFDIKLKKDIYFIYFFYILLHFSLMILYIYRVITNLDAGLCDLAGMCPSTSNSLATIYGANGGDIQCEFCEKVFLFLILV